MKNLESKFEKGTWKNKKAESKRKYKWIDKVILIIEDEKSNHLLVDYYLRPTSVTLLWAMDGANGVEITRERDDIDLILMDIRMPVMDGYEATKKIREFKPDIPIIAQTAYVSEEDKYKVIDVGCNDLITKPFSRDLLLHKIASFIN